MMANAAEDAAAVDGIVAQTQYLQAGAYAHRRRKSSLKDGGPLQLLKNNLVDNSTLEETILDEISDIIQDYRAIHEQSVENGQNETDGSGTTHVSNPPPSSDTDSAIIVELCQYENGFNLLCERIKLSMNNSKDAASFLKKRAAIEEEYAMKISKLVSTTVSADTSKGLHDKIAAQRLNFAGTITTIAEDMNTLCKNTEKSRKQLKEAGTRHGKFVAEGESLLEKTRVKYELCSEDWERAVRAKDGGVGQSAGIKRSLTTLHNMHFLTGGKNSGGGQAKLHKNEEDYRLKSFSANEAYKQQLSRTNTIRAEYFSSHLPMFITSLKETNDECDRGLKLHLLRYAQEMENAILMEARAISPLECDQNDMFGLMAILETIDTVTDFNTFMQNFIHIESKSRLFEKEDLLYKPFSSQILPSSHLPEISSPLDSPKNLVFGFDLALHLERDGVELPVVLSSCVAFIESSDNLNTSGLYRVSGSTIEVQKIKSAFDNNAVVANIEDYTTDVHNATSLLKLYFRKLPDSLFTNELYSKFINAAKIESDDRLRVVSIHELVNLLPDPNYATMQMLIGHLHKVALNESENKMNIQNLGIVWGPTLVFPQSEDGGAMDFKFQARVVETVLGNFEAIFDV